MATRSLTEPGLSVDLVPTDALATQYSQLLRRHTISPVVRTRQLLAEELTTQFQENTFDFVYSVNALDHVKSPVEALRRQARARGLCTGPPERSDRLRLLRDASGEPAPALTPPPPTPPRASIYRVQHTFSTAQVAHSTRVHAASQWNFQNVNGSLIFHSKHVPKDINVHIELRDLLARPLICNDRDTAVAHKHRSIATWFNTVSRKALSLARSNA